MAFKKFACLRIGRSPSRRRSLSPRHHENQIAVFENQIPEEIKGRTNVKLIKSPDEPLGLTIAGGCDKFSLGSKNQKSYFNNKKINKFGSK